MRKKYNDDFDDEENEFDVDEPEEIQNNGSDDEWTPELERESVSILGFIHCMSVNLEQFVSSWIVLEIYIFSTRTLFKCIFLVMVIFHNVYMSWKISDVFTLLLISYY